jgi:hypothetical protein
MSTICKLNRNVRERRAMRRNLIRELERAYHDQAVIAGRSSEGALVASATLKFLNDVRRSPWRTGDQKGAIFSRVAHELAAPTS